MCTSVRERLSCPTLSSLSLLSSPFSLSVLSHSLSLSLFLSPVKHHLVRCRPAVPHNVLLPLRPLRPLRPSRPTVMTVTTLRRCLPAVTPLQPLRLMKRPPLSHLYAHLHPVSPSPSLVCFSSFSPALQLSRSIFIYNLSLPHPLPLPHTRTHAHTLYARKHTPARCR